VAGIILITGGSRSGKSTYAQNIAESISGIRTYIATCPYIDEEMEERIRKHKESRRGSSWKTIEETVDLAGALRASNESRVILVDCLTLWINNLMYAAEQRGDGFSEELISTLSKEIIHVSRDLPGTVIFVTNEIGLGIIPDNPISRRYRDIAGRCNQIMAGCADTVVFMISGIPLIIKGERIK
jgi:adenosylcobinamide kinase/adenosylcobinamide-phosphate guanylyltransferase